MATWTSSSKKNPCPACGRTHDADCQIADDGKTVLCHTKANPNSRVPQPADVVGEYQFTGKYESHGVVERAVYVIPDSNPSPDMPYSPKKSSKKKGVKTVKPVSKIPAAQGDFVFYYPKADGSPCIRVVRRNDGKGGKMIWQEYWIEDDRLANQRSRVQPKPGDCWVSVSQRKVDAGKATQEQRDLYVQLSEQLMGHVHLYRIDEARALYTESIQMMFIVEGEPIVDLLLSMGIPATCNIGGSRKWTAYGHQNYRNDLRGLASFALAPDCDKVGLEHMEEIEQFVGRDFCQWVYAFPNEEVWKDITKGSGHDLKDWILTMRDRGVEDDDIMTRIFEAIGPWRDLEDEITEEEVAEVREALDELDSTQKTPAQDKADRLRLELLRYLKEPNHLAKLMIRNEICAAYHLSKADFSTEVERIDRATDLTKKRKFSGIDFFRQEISAIRYVIPRYVPAGEAVLLCSEAGVGKSALMTDMIYSVLSGEEFLGEKPDRSGKVLLISSDESASTTRRRMISRGFETLPLQNLDVWEDFDILHMEELEEYLEDNRPDVVVVDSITTMCMNVGISEKDPEFARYLYKLKNLLQRYGAASYILHHANKDPLAKGLAKVSGSARIPAAFWGVFLLEKTDKANPENPIRDLKLVKGREVELFTSKIGMNQRADWMEKGIFSFFDEDEESKKVKTWADAVVDTLRKARAALEIEELKRAIGNMGNYIYKVLDRLEGERRITRRRSTTNQKRWVWECPIDDQDTPSPSYPQEVNEPEVEQSTPTEVEPQTEVKSEPVRVSQQPEQQIPEFTSKNKQGEGGYSGFPEPKTDAKPRFSHQRGESLAPSYYHLQQEAQKTKVWTKEDLKDAIDIGFED